MSDLGNLTKNEIAILKQIRAGEYLSKLRSDRNLTLRDVASKLEVSFQYISDIEKGKKSPSDLILHHLSKIYELNIEAEVDLFHRYGRVPLLAEEEFESQESLHIIFATLRDWIENEEITNDQHQEFYAELANVFTTFAERISCRKE